MAELHKALECLRPKDFAAVPIDDLQTYLPEIFAKAELIANSVPPPPNGTPWESSRRSRTDANGARCAADLTVSQARRPTFPEHEALQKAWGKPVKLGAKETATGISVHKMAGHDRHGAWFARTSVHEGLGFAKWKKAMMREFPASLEVQGGPGEGNIRGIGGDQRLEDITVDGIGKLEVYQLSAQFPGPTAPREFITLLLTSPNCLSAASKVDSIMPRHYMVVSIPVTHDDAPPRDGMVRGFYESVEMIREIPLSHAHSRQTSASTSDLLQTKQNEKKQRPRDHTISFAESRGPAAKGEKIDRKDKADDDDPETNPVEWIMITRSDPGGGIPRFMVERSTPASIVQDAAKFLDWACAKDDFPPVEDDEPSQFSENSGQRSDGEHLRASMDQPRLSIAENNGILAGVGTSIADRTSRASSIRRPSHALDHGHISDPPPAYQPDEAVARAVLSLHRTNSQSSTDTSFSSIDSFASAEQYNTAPEGLPPSSLSSALSDQSIPGQPNAASSAHAKELQKIEEKRAKLKEKLESARAKEQKEGIKSAKDIGKAEEKHKRHKKKQEEKFAKEVQKLEAKREKETRKLLAKQQKEADKTALNKAQRERDEAKQRAELAEQELKILRGQLGELQRENTALVANIGKAPGGLDILKRIKEEMDGKKGRERASSRGSIASGKSDHTKSGLKREGSGLAHMESPEKS